MFIDRNAAVISRPHWLVFLVLAVASRVSAQADSTTIPEPFLREYATAYHENWVAFGGGSHQTYFYLPRTIRTTSRGTRTVWAVNIQSIQGGDTLGDFSSARRAVIKSREEAHLAPERLQKYATYLLTRVQWEVDCLRQRMRIIKFVDYDEEGNVLLSADTHEDMEEVIPETNGEGLLKAFCDPTRRNHFRDLLDGRPPKR